MAPSASFFNTSDSYNSAGNCYPCNPCSPDRVVPGQGQCYPCNPCSPDRVGPDGQCYPCSPCSPDQIGPTGQCYPCNPCSPDQIGPTGQCSPCSPCSPDRLDSGGSGSGCFISSACAESLGLPDTCEELQLLRAFRDRRRLYDEEFNELVEEYYQIAPAIVANINMDEARETVYGDLYIRLVAPCVQLIRENREMDALKLYTSIVRELQRRYLP